jgi:hypothetical protein
LQRPDPLDPKGSPVEDGVETCVLVLVDHDDAHGFVVLGRDRLKKPCELVGTTHRRDDEVERRRALRHAP